MTAVYRGQFAASLAQVPSSAIACQWHRDWTAEPIRVSIADDPSNGDVIRVWTEAWAPLADTAVASLARSAAEVSGVIAG